MCWLVRQHKFQEENSNNFFCSFLTFSNLLSFNNKLISKPNFRLINSSAYFIINPWSAKVSGFSCKLFLVASRQTQTPRGILYSEVMKRKARQLPCRFNSFIFSNTEIRQL